MSRRFDNFGQRLVAGVPDISAPEASDPETPETPKDTPSPADPEDPEEPTSEEDQEMDKDSPEYQAAMAAGREEANARMTAVFASEHFPGREAHAAKLLGKPGLSAEDITDLLADMPAAKPVDQASADAAAEAAARDEMRAAMDDTNADLGADQPAPEKSGKAKSDAVWDKANAKVRPNKKEG